MLSSLDATLLFLEIRSITFSFPPTTTSDVRVIQRTKRRALRLFKLRTIAVVDVSEHTPARFLIPDVVWIC